MIKFVLFSVGRIDIILLYKRQKKLWSDLHLIDGFTSTALGSVVSKVDVRIPSTLENASFTAFTSSSGTSASIIMEKWSPSFTARLSPTFPPAFVTTSHKSETIPWRSRPTALIMKNFLEFPAAKNLYFKSFR